MDYTIPIRNRPSRTWSQKAYGLLFCLLFDIGLIAINATQVAVLLILGWSSRRYRNGIKYTKGAFGCLLVLITQIFAPTQFSITFETRAGQGGFSAEEIERIVVRNPSDGTITLKLPPRHVLISNHQTYLDWLYIWTFAYIMKTHAHVFIVLKRSLKWLPVVGWGMQFFRFIFLARSWNSDKIHLVNQLSSIAKDAENTHTPFSLVIYPEGTLVSKDTRPISTKYANKLNISDLDHILLPRSTGLHYSLRALAPRIPSLRLLDVTMVYPGIPPKGWGQDYYTMASVFMGGVPPPVVHLHIRTFDVSTEVPIGDLSVSNPQVLPDGHNNSSTVETDIPEAERERFDTWLRNLWIDKDQSISRFHKTGAFMPDTSAPTVVQIPMKLRESREILDSFCFFIPSYIWSKLR